MHLQMYCFMEILQLFAHWIHGLMMKLMQQIAAENNLSETVFFVKENDHFRIRWFTPSVEVKLCGHATLATAHIFFTELNYQHDEIIFESLSGILKVTKKDENIYTLNFPANDIEEVSLVPEGLFEGLGIDDAQVYKSSFDYMVLLGHLKKISKH